MIGFSCKADVPSNSSSPFTFRVMEDPEQRILGASGTKRKRVDFVPAASPSAQVEAAPRSFRSVGDQYLLIVLKGNAATAKDIVPSVKSARSLEAPVPKEPALEHDIVCEICRHPLTPDSDKANTLSPNTHDLSLAHQVCVQHSYPPSHLDRTRQGLKYLSSYGWDPDARVGLGAAGEGIRAPIKAKVKNDTVGLGLKVPEGKKTAGRVEILDAGKVRKKDREDRKRREKLHERFYQSEDVEKYLGGS